MREAEELTMTDDSVPADNNRRLKVFVDHEDVFCSVLGLAETDYECVTVNNPWPEKGLRQGDIIMFCYGQSSGGGDIVLIEEDGQTRLGLIHSPGYLEIPSGARPLRDSEQVVAVGMALGRRLGGAGIEGR